MKVEKFFMEDFRQFSLYDCERSIPKLTDGLKPTQRKIIYGLLKRGENADEIKVAAAAGSISAVTAYHHGEGSMAGAIIGLAQDFCGANNLNFLDPNGQFGSRLSPESAAPRYIFTRLNDNFRKIFKKDDDIILDFKEDDGSQIEPHTYIPLLPVCLINGAEGMGTGFATKILMYDPEDLRVVLFGLLGVKDGKWPEIELTPSYRGFKGSVERKEGGQVCISGILKIVDSNTIKITELPVGTYLEGYKRHLNGLEEKGLIKSYEDNSTEDGFEFIITVPRTTTALAEDHLYNVFKLIARDTENFVLWDPEGNLKVYNSAVEVLIEFFQWRLAKYEQRRLKKIELLQYELLFNQEKIRFIKHYIDNAQAWTKLNKAQIKAELDAAGFLEEHQDKFLGIRIYNLSKEEIDKLQESIRDIEGQLKYYNTTDAKALFEKELKELDL